jgi:hypothetical protein
MASKCLELRGDLRAELARRDDDERERRVSAAIDALEDRERESARFTRAGLRLSEQVAPGAKVRDGKVLDRREARPTEVSRRAIEVRSKRDQERGFPSLGFKKSGPRGGPA